VITDAANRDGAGDEDDPQVAQVARRECGDVRQSPDAFFPGYGVQG